MKTLIINYDFASRVESVKFGSEIFRKEAHDDNCYYESGSYCIFISKRSWTYGLKFYVVENIFYPFYVINNIFNIYLLLYKNKWGTKPISIFKFVFKDKTNWGIKIEKAEFSKSGKAFFDKDEFRAFCSKSKGLKKDEPMFEEIYGKDWQTHYPELQFYVGNRNLKKTNTGKTVFIDIDPRWTLNNTKKNDKRD